MTRVTQFMVFGYSNIARSCVLELISEVGGPEAQPSMMGLECQRRTDLDYLRACHIYVSETSLFAGNSVNLVVLFTTQCRIKTPLYGFWTTPKMEKLIFLASGNILVQI